MTHSPVWFDGSVYVTLVAHVIFENDLIDPSDECPISGLLEYSLRAGEGILGVYDPDDDVMYEVHTVEDWEGLDKGAVQALLDAVDGTGDVLETGEDYRRVRNAYLRTGDPEAALMKHKIGTVVRIDYGEGYDSGSADILIKRDKDIWEASGQYIPWTDEQVEAEDYEVIYNA